MRRAVHLARHSFGPAAVHGPRYLNRSRAKLAIATGVILSGLVPNLSLRRQTSEESLSAGAETLRWWLAVAYCMS